MRGERLGEFEELVLLAIRTYRDAASSVGIKSALERDAKRRASLGAIYTALERLERKGLVSSWLGESTPVPGGRRRRLYRVTAAGVSTLRSAKSIREAMWNRLRTRPAENL